MRIACLLLTVIVHCTLLRAETAPATQPTAPITYTHEQRNDPAMQLHVVRVNLSDPGVSLHVVPSGDDPDGSGPWETTLQRVSEVATREAFHVAVNGDFFHVRDERQVMGQTVKYFAGNPGNMIGGAVSDGRIRSDIAPKRPMLVVLRDGRAAVGRFAEFPKDTLQAVSGNVTLIENGKARKLTSTQRHPRTAVGVDASGRTLTLLVVDGRRDGFSIGMTDAEMAVEFVRLGCHSAMNLDGGGSTTLVMKQDDGSYRIMNKPSDGSDFAVPLSIERPVANVIGLRINSHK